jgi:hypothetical protein
LDGGGGGFLSVQSTKRFDPLILHDRRSGVYSRAQTDEGRDREEFNRKETTSRTFF